MNEETRKKMEQALADNGYYFNRRLTDSELEREYEEMLDDLELLEEVQGMSEVEALEYVINKYK